MEVNMKNIEYAYKILAINPISIERNIEGRKRSEEEKLLFLKERKEHRIQVIKNKMQLPNVSEESVQKYTQEIELIQKAYMKLVNNIKTNALGTSNNKYSKFETIYNKINGIPENAYSIFGTSREICEIRESEETFVELDEAIKKRMEGLLKLAENSKSLDFRSKQKNELRKKQIKEAYELIKDSEARKEYNKILDIQQQEREENLLRNRYQIKTYKKFNGKIEYKECHDATKHIYYNQQNEPVILTNTGVIAYKDFQETSKIDEYEIEKTINDETYRAKIYINLSIFDLSTDKETEQPIVNRAYYDYVINNLLSVENISIAEKYNNGYMGKIIKNKKGNYEIVLDTKEATIIKEHSKAKNSKKEVEENLEKGDR